MTSQASAVPVQGDGNSQGNGINGQPTGQAPSGQPFHPPQNAAFGRGFHMLRGGFRGMPMGPPMMNQGRGMGYPYPAPGFPPGMMNMLPMHSGMPPAGVLGMSPMSLHMGVNPSALGSAGTGGPVIPLNPSTVPANWEEHTTEDESKYWYNRITKESTWEKPACLGGASEADSATDDPIDWRPIPETTWQKVTTEKGNVYYYNTETEESTWECPESIAEAVRLDDERRAELKRKAVEECEEEQASKRRKIEEKEDEEMAEALALEKAEAEAKAAAEEKERQEREEYQRKVDEFIAFLREMNMSQFTTWKKELPNLCVDPRFSILPTQVERKEVFEQYMRNRPAEIRKERRMKVDNFRSLMDELGDKITKDTSFPEFISLVGADPRYLAVEESERKLLFDDRVGTLKEGYEQERREKMEQKALEFIEMLKESKESKIRSDSKWSHVKGHFRDDPRYLAISSSSEREAVFKRYQKEMKKAEEEESERKRKEERTLRDRERAVEREKQKAERAMKSVRGNLQKDEATSAFKALVAEKVKDPRKHGSFDEMRRKLDRDPRFGTRLLSSHEKRMLFTDHIDLLLEQRKEDFIKLLRECDQVDMHATWDAVLPLLAGDERYERVYSRTERENIFNKYVGDMRAGARRKFLQMLKETPTLTSHTHGPEYEKNITLLRKDPRWYRFDCWPEERERLYKKYVSALTEKLPSVPQQAEKP